MTNREIQKQAKRVALESARRGGSIEPEDAWYEWSAANHVSSPATRHLFESMFRSHSTMISGDRKPWLVRFGSNALHTSPTG